MDSRKTSRSGGQRTPATMLALAAVVAATLLASVSFAAACGDGQRSAPSGAPSITGIVAKASPVDEATPGVGWFLIDQGSGGYDKASVTVTDETAWYRRDGDGVVTIDRPGATELTGKTVEVRFTGAVAESYPVQATAGWVVVGD